MLLIILLIALLLQSPAQATLYYADNKGRYLGGFDGGAKPDGAFVLVPNPPDHGADIWDGQKWAKGDRPVGPAQTEQFVKDCAADPAMLPEHLYAVAILAACGCDSDLRKLTWAKLVKFSMDAKVSAQARTLSISAIEGHAAVNGMPIK